MQNNNIGISKFLKTNGLFLIIGIAVMIATVTAISAILGKIPRYEIFYPITEVIICCIPAFVSTRSTIKRLNCLFLPTVVFQTTCIIIILLLFLILLVVYFSFIKNRGNACGNCPYFKSCNNIKCIDKKKE